MSRKTVAPTRIALAALFLLLSQRSAFADDIVDVTVNTSGLGSLGSSEIFFVLTGTGNNTATLSDFAFGGGSAGAADASNNAAYPVTGDMTSSVTLSDSAFLAVSGQYFTAGSQLSFVLDLTTNVVTPTPDQFSMLIVDPSGNPLPTNDPTGFDNLLAINVDSASPTTDIYSDLVTATTPTAVPEPSAALLLAMGLSMVAWHSRRRRAFA